VPILCPLFMVRWAHLKSKSHLNGCWCDTLRTGTHPLDNCLKPC
jgi:hypothetical protein